MHITVLDGPVSPFWPKARKISFENNLEKWAFSLKEFFFGKIDNFSCEIEPVV